MNEERFVKFNFIDLIKSLQSICVYVHINVFIYMYKYVYISYIIDIVGAQKLVRRWSTATYKLNIAKGTIMGCWAQQGKQINIKLLSILLKRLGFKDLHCMQLVTSYGRKHASTS